uniref:Aminoacyl-transfer RNA synthetases class-II family profile domain-containing protein n=1 Tax=Trichuris muris TaxID=70415 RepID=A0A5S6QM76_TRIMR
MPSSGCTFLSKVFQPSISRPWKTASAIETVSRSQRLLLDNGLIEHVAGKGLYHYMPLCVRALEKLTQIVRDEMDSLNASMLSLSTLCDRYSWEKSGRWAELGSELFKITGRSQRNGLLPMSHARRVYHRRIPADALYVQAGVGSIGGTLSHEYHLLGSSGENHILLCSRCGIQVTEEFNSHSTTCSNCKQEMKRARSHEIGHTFLLGTRYSSPLQARFQDKNGQRHPIYMGCYGIGLSRLLAALLDVNSTEDEIRWPGDVAFDDRSNRSVGHRLREAKRMGYPFVVVVNKTALQKPVPLLEVHDINNNQLFHMTHLELSYYFGSV